MNSYQKYQHNLRIRPITGNVRLTSGLLWCKQNICKHQYLDREFRTGVNK